LNKYSESYKKEDVLEEMQVIFSKGSEHRKKILDGNDFICVFKEKIRKKRVKNLEMFLMLIDPDRFGKMNFNWQ
jgi:hypothetical protein